MARAIDGEAAYRFLSEQLVKETGAFSKGVNKGLNIARSAMRNPDAIPALRPVSRGQIEQNKRRWEIQTSISPYYYCSGCGESFEIHSHDKEKYRFCPYCMSPMTDEAVDMVMERLNGIK